MSRRKQSTRSKIQRRRQEQQAKFQHDIISRKEEAQSHSRHAFQHGQRVLSTNFGRWEPPMQRIMEKLCPGGFDLDRNLVTADGWYCHDTAMFTLDPADCAMLLQKHLYSKQRNLNEQHVFELALNMNEALDVMFAITDDDWPVLVNGQHTLEAIILKEQPIRAKVSVYQCSDQAGVANLFKSCDDNKRRTKEQVTKAAVESGALASPIPSSRLTFWARKARTGIYGFVRGRIPKTNSSWVKDCARKDIQEFAVFMEDMSDGVPMNQVKKLAPQGVAGAFFSMFMSDKRRAARFIKAYLRGEENGIGLLSHDPRQRLRNFLLVESGNDKHNDKLIPELAGRTYWCWKKFCQNQPVRVSTPRDEFSGDYKGIPAYSDWLITEDA